MNVSDFQKLVESLAQFLEDNSAKGCGAELLRMRDTLRPFGNWSISQFADFLARAEEYHRTGIVPTKPTSRRQKPADPQTVKTALEKVQQCHGSALSENVTYSMISAEIAKLGKSLGRKEAIALAGAFGIAGAIKTKKAALEAIEGKISDRKESHDRAHR